MIKLGPISNAVPSAVKSKVAQIESEMKSGKFHPFKGPVIDQDGKQRLASGTAMSDKDLGGMNYYVEGVTSKLPKS